MARIAFLSLVFPPDSVSTAQIMGKLAAELKNMGHELNVLTSTPHYNRDLERRSRQPLHAYWGNILQKSTFCGMPVFHIKMPAKSSRLKDRMVPLLKFHLMSLIAGIFVLKKPDIIIVPSPPITLGLCAWLLGLFHRAKYIYNVQEIYPDCAISLGAIQNKALIRLLYKLEAFVYSKAVLVTVIAPKMARLLVVKGVSPSKIRIIPNFVNIEEMRPFQKDNSFSRQYGIQNKFVVSYVGNIGPAQDLEKLIDCAQLIKNRADIHFIIMGEGMGREKLIDYAKKKNLCNLQIFPYQPYLLVPKIYASSDLCLVPQLPSMTTTSIPSKVYSIMACARPVLAATDLESDLAELVNKVGCGIIARPGSAEQLAEEISRASENPALLRPMGEAGREHVIKYYTSEGVAKMYHRQITLLVRTS
jgi:glycosyltransferase involved in cell wall biosynthesis